MIIKSTKHTSEWLRTISKRCIASTTNRIKHKQWPSKTNLNHSTKHNLSSAQSTENVAVCLSKSYNSYSHSLQPHITPIFNMYTQQSTHNVIKRMDYMPPPFKVTTINLDFDIFDGYTIVTNSMTLKPNNTQSKILFDGDKSLQLESISVNCQSCDYTLHENGSLEITLSPNSYNSDGDVPIIIQNRIRPENNTSLEGLYKSSSIYCTQCEAEGFRKICYFFDRPDVTSTYSVIIRADKTKCPILLSNGNCVDEGEDENDSHRHWVKWVDPWSKPCYLFALVAGDLEFIQDTFETATSGKEVRLRIYTEGHNINKCDWAMKTLKQSMKWDETRFGLEYDLDSFNIVAVDDFNMGAMENKSLNIFNTKYVLASSDTATDTDYHNIQRVIGHEYLLSAITFKVVKKGFFE